MNIFVVFMFVYQPKKSNYNKSDTHKNRFTLYSNLISMNRYYRACMVIQPS